ncbi:Fe-S cluster assembly protein SufD [Suicoccus acidiformans]|uniref:Fe-S cluster assembly protein SufD n=1 Tax=Suicoccus acidiformans TaxID=2036206 RepID=A0A347WK12_9LACT|nr:Fe-S cluster assembly protein SufD [Suicoccus acidiformans]AXY25419.1 Fe-S cluster assembly protein SufD [Suicoccus acidiformans]
MHKKAQIPEWFKQTQASAAINWKYLQASKIERVDYSNWALYPEAFSDVDLLSEASLQANAESHWSNQDQTSARVAHIGQQTYVDLGELAETGIIVKDLYQALLEDEALVKQHLFSVIPAEADRLAAYNLAFNTGGLFIYIPEGLDVTLPLESVLKQLVDGSPMNKRVLLVAGENSRVNYLERLVSDEDASGSATIMVEVIAKAGAHINFLAIDQLGSGTEAYIRRHGITGRDAVINWSIGAMNDGNTILDMDTYLVGQGSESDLSIIGISDGEQVQGIDSKVVNEGHHTRGNIFQHGVVLEAGTLTFNGIGHILKNAKFADAQQESRVMMLSEDSRADANPILLIDEFEVTAGHAASIGQIDEEALYYLMSRGISERDAEYLMIRGFLGHVISAMPNTAIREEMVATIDYKLRTF